jgi:hypothetical protein
MKIIVPTPITDAMLTATDVAENDVAEFSMGATYGSGDRCMDTTGLDVAPATEWAAGDLITGQSSGKTAYVVDKITSLTYRIRERSGDFTLGEIIGVTGVGAKLADQGATHPTVTAAADKVHKIYEAIPIVGIEVLTLDVAPATAWSEGRIITGQTSGKTATVIARLTDLTYLIRNRSGDFTLGEIIGVAGIAAELADQGAAKPTVAAATNTARYPATDLARATPVFWKKISRTNRWKAFDDKLSDQVAQAESITLKLTPGIADAVALLYLDATSISLTVTDPEEGEVFNEARDLISTSGIVDAYSYCFHPIIRKTDHVEFDLPPYGAAEIEITIANSGGTAKVGEIVAGISREIGTTLYTPTAEIVDYSQKAADEQGNYAFVEGVYSKRYDCTLHVRNELFDEVFRLLALYRSTPIVYVALEAHAPFIAYGKYNNFALEYANSVRSVCTLEIEGLS